MLTYCDYLADKIRNALVELMKSGSSLPVKITSVGRVKLDLSDSGSLQSTKKSFEVEASGKKYRVTVEEV